MPEALVIGAVAGAFLAVVVITVRLASRRSAGPPPSSEVRPGVRTVTLGLAAEVDDPEPVRRLAAAAALPLFEDDPLLTQVEVRDRQGSLLAMIDRADGLVLAEHDPFEDVAPAEDLILPSEVRDRLPEHPSLVEVVGAILEAAGHDVDRDGDILKVGDRAVVVLEATHPDALSAAYLRYRDSGARTGVVVSRRSVAPSEIHRRELLAPDLRYADTGALQRMADAVAVGADPIAFALGPPSAEG